LRVSARTDGSAGAILTIVLLGAAGCSTAGEARDFDPQDLDRTPGWIAVRTVPVILQKEKTDCGAASLAMVLSHWKIDAPLDEVVRHCPLIAEQGIRAKDLRDYARSCGLQSYLIHGCWEDLGKEVGQDHPLIVGLVKPDGSGIITHYEVVVAVQPETNSVVTLDPARGWSLTSRSGFCKEWEPAGFLTLVFFRGDPPSPKPDR